MIVAPRRGGNGYTRFVASAQFAAHFLEQARFSFHRSQPLVQLFVYISCFGLQSNECVIASGLKAGAKSGLSVVVCGCLYLSSVTIGPLLASAPATGTAPVLLMIGLTLQCLMEASSALTLCPYLFRCYFV